MLAQKQQQRNWLKEYQVQDLSRSIVREYLLQNKLTETLQALEKEDKRSQKKIKKSILIKILSMNNLIYFNKQSKDPYSTILDTLVGYLKDKFRMKIELSCYEDNESNSNTNKNYMENSLKESEPEIKLDKSLNNTVKLENQRNNKLINSKISQAEKPKRPVTSGHRVSGKNVQNIYAQLSKIDFQESQKKKLIEKQRQEVENKNRAKQMELAQREKRLQEQKQRIEAIQKIRLAQAEKIKKQEQKQRRQREQQKQKDRKAQQQRKIHEKRQAEEKQRQKRQEEQKRKRQQQQRKQQQQKKKEQEERKMKQRQMQEARQKQRKKKEQEQKQRLQQLNEDRQKIAEKQKQQDSRPQESLQKQPSRENSRVGMRKLNKKKQQESSDFKIDEELNTSKKEKQVKFILDQPEKLQNKVVPEVVAPKKQEGQKMVVIGGKRKKNNDQAEKPQEKKFKFDDNFVDEPLRGNDQKYVYQKLQFNKITLKNPDQATINYREKPAIGNKKCMEKPITQQLALQLKKAVFQNGSSVLPKSWYQGFILSPHANTPYGLQQIQGGPCGIIAAIQCFFLKHLLHLSKPTIQQLSNETLRQNCLVAAITDMLFKSKSSDKIILALPPKSFSGLKLDISSFRVITFEANTFAQAYQSLYQYKSCFIGKNNHGVAVLMFCMVLTKGIENIWTDMDMPDNPLIGHHGHCTQQLVNLFITGHASSNIFDGITNLDQITLKGIPQKSQFGFLTIYETNQQLHVGKNLKNPIYPFWIICKQFHYHVIFANNYLISQNNNTSKFDIVYFDGLYNCADRIVITLESYGFEEGQAKEKVKVKDLPLIQQVMKTKWGLRKADWNGSIKIL